MMKRFFANKVNVFLTVLIVGMIAAGSYLGYVFFLNPSVKAIDFSQLTEIEIREWSSSNLKKKELVIDYAYDEKIEEGKVISQLPLEGEKITDQLQIVISKGFDPELVLDLPDPKGMDFDQMDLWLKENHFDKVELSYELSDQEVGTLLDVSPKQAKRSELIVLTLSAGDDEDKISVILPDFSTYSKDEISSWSARTAISVIFSYDFSDSIEKEHAIKQDPAPGTTMTAKDSATVVISLGKGITLSSLQGKSRSEAENWLKDHSLKVSIEKDYSDRVPEGMVISQKPSGGNVVEEGSTVKLVISLGKEPSAVIPDNLLGLKEDAFISKLNSLGFQHLNKLAETYYSTLYPFGTIYSYEDGEFPLSKTISYSLSLGAYSFDASQFNGKTKEEISELIAYYNGKNARISTEVNYTNAETESASQDGKADSCSFADGVISCKIYSLKKVDLKNYVGTKENPCGNKNACDIGGIKFSISEKYDPSEVGTVISQSVPSGKVPYGVECSLVISKGPKPEQKAYIGTIDDYSSLCKDCETADDTIAKLKSSFSQFSNVSYKKVESYMTVGKIVSISVNGSTSYECGNYPLSTPIVIEVCASRLN